MIKADFFQLLDHFQTAGPWLERRAAFKAILAGFILAATLTTLKLVPSYTIHLGRSQFPVPILPHTLFLVLPFLAPLVWLVWRKFYLDSGASVKLGVAYEAHMIDLREWRKTRDVLAEFFRKSGLRKLISIRFVPTWVLSDPDECKSFRDRYQFTMLASVEHSAPTKAHQSQPDILKLKIHGTQKIYRDLLDDLQAILNTRGKHVSQLDMLKATARTLHQLMLLHIAVGLYHNKQYNHAAIFLRYIDEALEGFLPADREPRSRIRATEVLCRLHPARFPAENPPPNDQLEQLYLNAKPALDYINEFPGVAIPMARLQFYRGDINAALLLTEQGAAIPNVNVNSVAFQLNLGILNFLCGRWQRSYDAYNGVLCNNTWPLLNWNDLVQFSDYCAEFEYDGISVVQRLYRILAGVLVPHEIEQRAQQWIVDDASRAGFLDLLEKARKSVLTRKSNGANTAKPRRRSLSKKDRRKSRKKPKHRR